MPELVRSDPVRLLMYALLLLVSLSFSGLANDHAHNHEHDDHEDDHSDEFEQHSSHEHGHAVANISYVENILKVDLTLPAIDLFGFEHQARNAHEKQIRQKTIKILETPENVITFQPDCKLDTYRVASTAESQSSEHSDVNVSYVFDCQANQPVELRFLLFKAFKSLREVEVQYISTSRQNAFTATPDRNRFVIN